MTHALHKSGTPRLFFGWWIVVVAGGMFAIQSATFGLVFGSYLLEVQDEFGWSKFAISGAFSLSQLVSGLLGPGQGWLIDRFGPRLVMRMGVAMFGLSFMLLSIADSLWMFYAVIMMLGAGANLAGFLTLNTSVANWFIRRRALALGLASTGLGIGGMLAPITTWSLVTFGWRPTALGSGILVLVIALPLAHLVRRRPEDHGLQPDGRRSAPESEFEPRPRRTGVGMVDFTVGEAMRDRSFWLISAGHGIALATVFAVMVHLVPYLVETRDWGETSAQGMFALVAIASVIGQIGGGLLGDRYSKTRISAACMLGHSAALMMLAFGGGSLIVEAVLLHGLSWGVRGPLMMAVRADFYGRLHFGTIMGYSVTLVMIGPLIGPASAGAMNDHFGGYTEAFAILGVVTGISAIFFLMARTPPMPKRMLGASAQSASQPV